MLERPLALDLFCGGGGAALGLIEAGFDVVGVDNVDHSRVYPGKFILGDALHPPVRLECFALIWASPPCQAYSTMTNMNGQAVINSLPHLIPQVQALLANHPYTVIENVPNAPIRRDLVLTGPMVGLHHIERKRHFELSWFKDTLNLQPAIRRTQPNVETIFVNTNATPSRDTRNRRRDKGLSPFYSIKQLREVMGITTPMTTAEVGEAVAPPMAKYIGELALKAMGKR